MFEEIIKENKDLLVFFSAVWCSPCEKARTALEQIVDKYPHVRFIEVDVDENERAAQFAEVTSLPEAIAYKYGQRCHPLGGATTSESFNSYLSCYFGG